MCLRWAHHSVWGQIVFTFIYCNSFPTSPLSVAKESIAVEKCIRQPWRLSETLHISTVISLLIHLMVDVKKCVRHFFSRTYPLYMRPWWLLSPSGTQSRTSPWQPAVVSRWHPVNWDTGWKPDVATLWAYPHPTPSSYFAFLCVKWSNVCWCLESMLDGELMFAVLDVAEVFSHPHILLPKEHSLDAVFFPLPSPLVFPPLSSFSSHLRATF